MEHIDPQRSRSRSRSRERQEGGKPAPRETIVRPGDWTCPSCGRLVYGCRSVCKCGQPKPVMTVGGNNGFFFDMNHGSGTGISLSFGGAGGGKRDEIRPGDWTCPNCGRNVYASKLVCKCGQTKPPSFGGDLGNGATIGQQEKGEVRPGDWTCPSCGVNVYGSRAACFRCSTRKPAVSTNAGFGLRGSAAGNTFGGWPGGNIFNALPTAGIVSPQQLGGQSFPGMGIIGGGGGGGKRDEVRPGDWTCPNCSRNVYASKLACKCGQPKPV